MWKNVRYWDGGLGEPSQITGGRRRVVWVDWEPRAQGRRQSEGVWECLVSKGLEVADGFPLRTRWELAAEGVGGCPTGVCGWKQGCHVPNSQEGRRPQPHRQQCKMTLEYLLNKGHKARESPASFIHHWP